MLEKLKKEIDLNIIKVLDEEISKTYNNDVKEYLKELRRLSQKGKRVRGILVYIGSLLLNEKESNYLDIATAIEIFQTSVLIHDDIIDEAKERRGIPTITALEPNHYGLSKAICTGDLGFFLSYKLICNSKISESKKNSILKIFTDTLYNTVYGEIIDIALPMKDLNYHLSMEEKNIYEIYINKTSWYTFIGPLLMGAILNGAQESDYETLINIGINLGIAFQIKDDLLGLYSDNEKMGKTLNDIAENKQTIIYKYAIDHASKQELEIINKYYGKSNTTEENKIILNLFEKLQAKDNAENLVKDYTTKAIDEINKSNFKNKKLLIDLATKLINREN